MSSNSTLSKVVADKNLSTQILEKMKQQLKDLPEGRLCTKTINNKEYWYRYSLDQSKQVKKKSAKKQEYLSKKNMALKHALQERFFIENAVKHLEQNIAATNEFLSRYEPFVPSEIISNFPNVYRDFELGLDQSYFETFDSDCLEGLGDPPLNKNDFYAEGLVHSTSKGLKVRSKSESIIATLLDMNKIPYRYESPLTLGDHTFYPDFTIMRPADQKLFYWEHFGMVDNQNYNENMQKKLLAYIQHGLIPWDRLIATFESNENAFDAQHINKIIEILFL